MFCWVLRFLVGEHAKPGFLNISQVRGWEAFMNAYVGFAGRNTPPKKSH